MRTLIDRGLDYLTSEPLRIRSFLRPALIVLIALLVSSNHVEHWHRGAFIGVLAFYLITSLVWLAIVLRGPGQSWLGWVSTAVDVLFVLALCIVSGNATIWLLPIFFLLPISTVFLDSPVVTAILGLSAPLGYLLAWFVLAVRDTDIGIPAVAYVQAGCLLWLAVALTALSYTLNRRAARVRKLLEVRRRLVSEVMQADERNDRRLSEQLHDGPLQNLLAARLDLDELRINPTAEGFEFLESALLGAVSEIRAIVATLHPQVLSRLGLTAAVRELVSAQEQRSGCTIDAELQEVGHPACEAMLYRAARELMINAQKHSRASLIRIRLRRSGPSVVLVVDDNGVGFDTDILDRRVAEGHIGLASLVAGIEALDGSVDLRTEPGEGTTVTVTMTERPAKADTTDSADTTDTTDKAKKRKKPRSGPTSTAPADTTTVPG